jgi:hypothetical protein
MPLRKSPKRTRALLAANRRNSRKSTGPRTAGGKQHSAWNALRYGRRTHASCRCIPLASGDLKAFTDFYFKLHDAIIPVDTLVGEQAVLSRALEVWKVKRILERWIDTRTDEDWLMLAAGAAPPPSFWRLRLRRPGVSVPDWTVTVSVWLRWGRGPGLSRRSATEDDERPNRSRMHTPRMHTMVSVHSTGPFRPAESFEVQPMEPECERTKPESDSNQRGSENMSVPGAWDPDFAAAYELADRLVGWLMGWGKRTKPESIRKQESCKNMSMGGGSPRGNSDGGDRATGFGKILDALRTALVSRKEPSQLELFQTKPEYDRKVGVSQIISKSLGRLGAAFAFLMKRGSAEARLGS